MLDSGGKRHPLTIPSIPPVNKRSLALHEVRIGPVCPRSVKKGSMLMAVDPCLPGVKFFRLLRLHSLIMQSSEVVTSVDSSSVMWQLRTASKWLLSVYFSLTVTCA